MSTLAKEQGEKRKTTRRGEMDEEEERGGVKARGRNKERSKQKRRLKRRKRDVVDKRGEEKESERKGKGAEKTSK